MFGIRASYASYVPVDRVGSEVLPSSDTLPMKRHSADTSIFQGLAHVIRRLWRQRGLTVSHVGPYRPAQSKVCAPGCGVVGDFSKYEPENRNESEPIFPKGNR